jgi:cell division protein FtsB
MRKDQKVKLYRDYTIAVGLIIFGSFVVVGVVDLYQKEEIARTEAASARIQYENLSKRHGELTAQVEALESTRGQEAILREDFGVALPDEEVIIIMEKEVPDAPLPLPWWRKLFGYVGL